MRAVSFFDKETGELNGEHKIFSNDADLAANTPPGHLPIDGHHDHRTKRVDVQARPPAIVQRDSLQPLAPQTAEGKRRAAIARLQALEASQGRLLRAVALGKPGALEQLQALDDQISQLEKQSREAT